MTWPTFQIKQNSFFFLHISWHRVPCKVSHRPQLDSNYLERFRRCFSPHTVWWKDNSYWEASVAGDASWKNDDDIINHSHFGDGPLVHFGNSGKAHSCLMYLICMIHHRPLVDTTHISLPVHCVWPTCFFLMSVMLCWMWLFAPPSTHFYPTPDGQVYPTCKHAWFDGCFVKMENWSRHTSIHSFRSCCNLSELSIKSILSPSLPPLPPPVLPSSDNHPGSAPILQLAASSFQNAGAPPHETKSKFQWETNWGLLCYRNNEL